MSCLEKSHSLLHWTSLEPGESLSPERFSPVEMDAHGQREQLKEAGFARLYGGSREDE